MTFTDNRPVTPPPEFEDWGCSTYSYYDEELQESVSYTIREEPKVIILVCLPDTTKLGRVGKF